MINLSTWGQEDACTPTNRKWITLYWNSHSECRVANENQIRTSPDQILLVPWIFTTLYDFRESQQRPGASLCPARADAVTWKHHLPAPPRACSSFTHPVWLNYRADGNWGKVGWGGPNFTTLANLSAASPPNGAPQSAWSQLPPLYTTGASCSL